LPFDRYDISDAVRKLGLRLDSSADFDLEIKVKAYNSSYLDSSILPRPSVIFEPGTDNVQNDVGETDRRLVRKNVKNLSPKEIRSLKFAMKTLQVSHSTHFHDVIVLCWLILEGLIIL
jgi:hypothetical protein